MGMKNSKPKGEMIKTSVAIPKDIWRAAHIRALDEGRDFQDIVAAALAMYLKTPQKREGGAA